MTTAACREPTRAAATGASIRARRATPRSRPAIPADARCRATTTSLARATRRTGSDCTVSCSHEEIREATPFDDCCPAGASHDGRQSRQRLLADVRQRRRRQGRDLRHGDPARHARRLPDHGRLPARDVRRRCVLISFGTCSAVCSWNPIVAPSGKDPRQLLPARRHPRQRHRLPDRVWQRRAGDGQGGEHCDPGIPPGVPGACPTTCDDGMPARIDYFLTNGCQAQCGHTPITTPISGDGCCPPAATNATDDDCPPVCGNGVRRARRDAATATPARRRVRCHPRRISGRRRVPAQRGRGRARIGCTAHCEITEIDACDPDAEGRLLPRPLHAGRRSRLLAARAATASSRRRWAKNATSGMVGASRRVPDLVRRRASRARTTTWSARGRVPRGACTCPSPISVPATAAAFRARRPIWIPTVPPTCGDGIVERPTEICDFGVGAGCPSPETCQSNDACTTYARDRPGGQLQRGVRRDADHRLRRRRPLLSAGVHRGRRQ